MRYKFSLSTGVSGEGHTKLVVNAEDGTVGEIMLVKPLPTVPSELVGTLYIWDKEQIESVNEIKHPSPAHRRSSADRALDRAMTVLPGDIRPRAPSGLDISAWRKYLKG